MIPFAATWFESVFKHYDEQGEQQRQQAYQMLKTDFTTRLQQAVRQQGGKSDSLDINVETLPQFKEEWQGTLAQLDSQYIRLIEEYKQNMSTID